MDKYEEELHNLRGTKSKAMKKQEREKKESLMLLQGDKIHHKLDQKSKSSSTVTSLTKNTPNPSTRKSKEVKDSNRFWNDRARSQYSQAGPSFRQASSSTLEAASGTIWNPMLKEEYQDRKPNVSQMNLSATPSYTSYRNDNPPAKIKQEEPSLTNPLFNLPKPVPALKPQVKREYY